MFKPRPKQAEVIAYQGGKMGVSAVPGSGKTATLSYLASLLVAGDHLEDEQEVLIVTLVRSAVGNFASSLSKYLRKEHNLLAGMGYRVVTLHSLAHDIVRERPALVGLDNDFTIIDEREALDIIASAVDSWVNRNADFADLYLSGEHFNNYRVRNNNWVTALQTTATNFIKMAKDKRQTFQDIGKALDTHHEELRLAEFCAEIYARYEYALRYRGAVDFQDLIAYALTILETDADYLARLRQRYPYILEDEAQDSSKLQEDILRLLAGDNGNWVRVGDPNQAIYESFTTANPQFLRDFMREDGVMARSLPNSGRSTQSIISLANYLIDWSLNHPNEYIVERKPLDLPYIEVTPPNDPQGNPDDQPEMIFLREEKYTPDTEREAIVKSLKGWLANNQDKTCAVLLPFNESGAKLVSELRQAGVDYVENLRSTNTTRATVGAIAIIVNYLADPKDVKALQNLYRVWRRDEREDERAKKEMDYVRKKFRELKQVEDYLYPRLTDWLDIQTSDDDNLREHLEAFRVVVHRWQAVVDLPIDQLIMTIATDLFTLDTELATAYALALYMRRHADYHPFDSLPEHALELQAIAQGRRKFEGMSDDDGNFDPDEHKGKATITTMHKSKGLEWDRVYIMAVNNYTFPSLDAFDNYMSEKWFLRDNLNIEAETIAQLDCLIDKQNYFEGRASDEARVEYVAERLRLLYVAITRARRELVITWNNGRQGRSQEARAVVALRVWWAEQMKGKSS